MKGLIFSIVRYSIHDGPGIRVTFFLKGCPLSCWWCHNPEGQKPEPEKTEVLEKVGEKSFKKKEEAGRYYSVEEVVRIIEGEKIFIRQSGGGVTFSGGEPLFQKRFLTGALEACKAKGYHTAIDTSGYSGTANYAAILPLTDLFLYDLKHPDDEKHRRYTGVSNSLILKNFNMLLEKGKDLYVRIPVIPGINDSPEDLDEFRGLLLKSKRPNLKKICLLPYHKTGSSKYERFGIPSLMKDIDPPSRERMNELKLFFEETGTKVKIGG